jgi:quinol monooxygenase YgiN
MTASVIVKLKVDPERMEKLFSERLDDLLEVKAAAEAAGAVHHLFAAGDGEVLIVDEWEDAESFGNFFDNPTIAEMMAEVGVQGPPEVSIYQVLESPDRF